MAARQPLVSVIIPSFNRAREVCIAIRSALAQSYTRREVIVVDDGSTDDTPAVLAREFNGQIRYVEQANAGVSSARNHGARQAKGDVLAFLDSDDTWHPHKLARQLALLDKRPACAMVVCDVEYVDQEFQPLSTWRRRAQYGSVGPVLSKVIRNPALAPSTAIVTRAAFEAVSGFDVSLPTAEDIDFHLKIAREFDIGLVEEPLALCMRGGPGLSALSRTYSDYLTVVLRFLADPATRISNEDRSAALFNAYLQAAKGFLIEGDLARSLELVARAAGCVRRPVDVATIAGFGSLMARNTAIRSLHRVRGTK